MKVLHINSIFSQGGAALLMRILAKNIEKNQGVEQFFIVKKYSGEKTERIFQTKDISNHLGCQKLSRIISEYGNLYRFLPLEAHFILKKTREISPDIIHIHNIRPVQSFINNVGWDNSGTHTRADEKLITILDDNFQPQIETIEPNKTILKNFRRVFDPQPRYSLKRFIGKILKRMFK